MRTTLTIDDDLADELKERSKLLDKPFKRVVNEALRRGLEHSGASREKPIFSIEPNQSGLVSGVDPRKLNQLVDELEVEEFMEASD
ncbi:MAG: type II toxin-antitoxin system VapB family antitoxin [Verrucomicrobiales bacterium]|nr:type II toxin-antitoxin system VapB family antitoxin [Verrucomicrobiales bacterium]